MKLFFSGWQATRRERELEVIKAGRIKHRCFSFTMLQRMPGLPYYLPHLQGAYDACIENGIGIMMDSGVVSWRSYRASLIKRQKEKELAKLCGEDEFIRLYVDYCKANMKKWDLYMTIDLERNAASILERHKRIEKMGIRPIPVFHGDSTVDFLRKYYDMGHKLIALASWPTLRTSHEQKRRYLDGCFALAAKLGFELHGLAMTAGWMLLEFPWYSVDSSSWSRVAGYGGIMRFDPITQRTSVLHVSERHSADRGAGAKLNQRMMLRIKEEIETEGYDFEALRTSFVARHVYNAASMMQIVDIAEKRHRVGWNLLF